jgi:hypothetical protein
MTFIPRKIKANVPKIIEAYKALSSFRALSFQILMMKTVIDTTKRRRI